MSENQDVAAEQLAAEQAHLDVLYRHLDAQREQAAAALAEAIGNPTTRTPAARSERDAFVRLYSRRVSQLQAVEARLCFGRLDLLDGRRRYIGRIGISDSERTELLVDWRARAAEPFYQATAAQPQEVIRRRQLSTNDRRVTGVQDEVLDLGAFESGGIRGERVVIGEGALFASLDASRSGRMRDIVATIQADQDRAIRAPLAGVFVVQGGPGTGKTAVALHRTAFLLYANRDRIARTGVLLVGPNHVFLRYIEQVLPALGESEAVVMVTPGELFPGVRTDQAEADPAVAALKADPRMVRVIREAVRRRQRGIDRPIRIDLDGAVIHLEPDDVRHARERARRSGDRHNQARTAFAKELLRILVRSLADARSIELDADARATLLAELYESRDVRREINLLWMPLTPERLLRDLYADDRVRQESTRMLRQGESVLLRRERNAPWTTDDVPLLDEAAELLGPDTATLAADDSRARAAAEQRAEVEYADAVSDTFGGKEFITAEDLAQRYRGVTELDTVADRASGDREWTFGHIVVDEAQELSPMMWRLLMRRSASHSMTLVGDVAQTGSAAGAASWAEVLRPHVGDRWQLATLNVNYRTPGQIMDLAGSLMRANGRSVDVPESARVGEFPPEFTRVSAPLARSSLVADAVTRMWKQVEDGTVAVITSRRHHDAVTDLITAALGPESVTADTAALSSPVSVLTVADAKGLEFDGVVLLEPAAILAESPRGVNDLYVALTRPTKRLHVLHADPLPAGMTP